MEPDSSGRFTTGAREGSGQHIADIGCPDCRGVLSVGEQGKKGLLHFVCRVGHGFSGATLIEAQERELERKIWSALALLEETIAVQEELGRRAGARGLPDRQRILDERVSAARRHAEDLRRMIRDGLPPGTLDEL